MLITLIIVGGITVIAVVSVIGDYLTKTKKSKSAVEPKKMQDMERRIIELEKRISEQEIEIGQLESDVKFTNKLLEDKTK